MKTVLFVGDKPSRLNKNPNVAFVGAKCHKKLMKWIEYIDPDNYLLLNSNTSELLALITTLSTHVSIVALGKSAQKRLDTLGVKHYKLDHPSGLNRKLNIKEYELDMLKKCRKWLYESN